MNESSKKGCRVYLDPEMTGVMGLCLLAAVQEAEADRRYM